MDRVSISIASAGTFTLVPAAPSPQQITEIYMHGSGGSFSTIFKSGDTALCGAIQAARVLFGWKGRPWFFVESGQPFVVTISDLGGALPIGGWLEVEVGGEI